MGSVVQSLVRAHAACARTRCVGARKRIGARISIKKTGHDKKRGFRTCSTHTTMHNTTMTIIRPTADVRGGGQTTGVVTSAEGGSAGMRLSIETTTGTDRIGASERRGLRLSHAGTRARVATMDCVFPARGGLLSPRTSPSRERVHATSLPNDDPARIAGHTPASRVGARRNAMSKPTWFRGGGLWYAYLALRAKEGRAEACAR